MAGDSKTEKATPKRRRDERNKGNVLMSKEAVSVATLLGSLFMVQMMSGLLMEQINAFWNLIFSYMASDTLPNISLLFKDLFKAAIVTFITMVGPFLAVTAVLAIGVTFYQTKLLVTTYPLKPKLSKLNPLQGLKRLFSLRSTASSSLRSWFSSWASQSVRRFSSLAAIVPPSELSPVCMGIMASAIRSVTGLVLPSSHVEAIKAAHNRTTAYRI